MKCIAFKCVVPKTPPKKASLRCPLGMVLRCAPKRKKRVDFEDTLIYLGLVSFGINGEHSQLSPTRGICPSHEPQHIKGTGVL